MNDTARTRAGELRRALRLTPHPEGGAFAEVYTSPVKAGGRPIAGSIYFLLEGEEISHMHQIDCDEIWYFHEGGGMRITVLDGGQVSRILLGHDLDKGQTPMAVVPAGALFASENIDKNSYTLVSCATAPAFTYDTFRLIDKAELKSDWPDAYPETGYLALPKIDE